MDRFLGYLLGKLSKFFNVGTYIEQVEFASHVGWSIAIPAIGEAVGGEQGLKIGFVCAIVNSLFAEFVADGHFMNVFRSRESRAYFRDFCTDFLTKVVPGALYVLVKLRG